MSRSLCALVCAICSACAGSTLRPPDTQPSRPLARVGDGAETTTAGVDLRVEEATGASHAEVAALLAPARGALQGCSPGVPVTIRVRITNQGGSLAARLEPGPSLDPVLRECVLEALSTVSPHADGESGAVPRPSRFTSLLSISF